MSIYFSFANPGAAFSAATHAVESNARAITVTMREEESAVAVVELPNADVAGIMGPAFPRACWISQDDAGGTPQPLFHGRVTGTPQNSGADFTRVEFVATPSDMATARAGALTALKTLPFYDPLFHDVGDDDPVEVLDGYSRVWDVNPKTWAVTTVPLDGDGSAFVIDPELIDADSWAEKVTHDPIPTVAISIEAQWLQKASGIVDAGAQIRAAAGGVVTTISPSEAFADCWPAPDTSLGGGWRVVEANVNPQLPANRKWPSVSFEAQDGEKLYCARQTYAPIFTAEWQFSQRRVERLNFVVTSDAQSISFSPPEGERIDFKLRDVTQNHVDGVAAAIAENSATFFPTPRGRQTVDHALCVAASRIAHSLRCIDVTFTCPGWPAELITLATTNKAEVTTSIATGGWVRGKVKEISRSFGSGFETRITLSVSVGTGNITAGTASADEYTTTSYTTGPVLSNGGGVLSGVGLVASDYSSQAPSDTWIAPGTVGGLVTAITVENQAPAQESLMRSAPAQSPADFRQRLFDATTRVAVTFARVEPAENSENTREMTATISPAYSIAAGIDLETA